MNFQNTYTPEQETFAREVRDWLDRHIPQDLVKPRSILKMSREQWLKRRDLCRKLGEKGWLYPTAPREYGGGGLNGDMAAVIQIEMAARGLSLPPPLRLRKTGRPHPPRLRHRGTKKDASCRPS